MADSSERFFLILVTDRTSPLYWSLLVSFYYYSEKLEKTDKGKSVTFSS